MAAMFGKMTDLSFESRRISTDDTFSRKHQARKHPNLESKVVKIIRQESESNQAQFNVDEQQTKEEQLGDDDDEEHVHASKINSKKKNNKNNEKVLIAPFTSQLPILPNFAPVRVFQCSICHQQGTYKWVVERHIRAKHPEKMNAHVIELPAELSVKLQKITSPLKRFRCSLCSLQSKHSWVVMRVSFTLVDWSSFRQDVQLFSIVFLAYKTFSHFTNGFCARHSTRRQTDSRVFNKSFVQW